MPGAFAVYLRVSSDKQDSANQEPDIKRLVDAREGQDVKPADGLLFVETESAAKVRPEFDRMMEAARVGKFRTLYIWSIDRFGRSMFETARDITTLVEKYNVTVRSVRESWVETTADPMLRKLLLAIFCWVAEHERDRLIQRTRAGLERAKRAGKVLGRPTVAIPAPALARALELRQPLNAASAVLSWRAIAEALSRAGLGNFSHATLARACTESVPSLDRGTPGFPPSIGRLGR